MRLLGIDVGTTHCKAALFDGGGTMLSSASADTPTRYLPEGGAEHDPEELWEVVSGLLRQIDERSAGPRADVVGVASMAEAGCLVDRGGGPLTPILPWFDTRFAPQAEKIAHSGDVGVLFGRTGLYPSYKHGLAKLLWLRERSPELLEQSVWLSVADWVVFRLTGRMVTDPTLAARTYAFNLGRRDWDQDTIREFSLSPDLFPQVVPSGAPAGGVSGDAARATRLAADTPVAVSGHDHICTLLAAGVVEPGPVLDSMGTAESLVGVLPSLEIGARHIESGLSFVPHVLPDCHCWLGGISSSGGSVEWLLAALGLSGEYDQAVRMLEQSDPDPTGVLFFPYLAGSGAPRPDQRVRAAFVGLDAEDGAGTLLRAVIEGTCFEVEAMRRAAEALTGMAIDELCVVGGGARNQAWVRIKADVTGCRCVVPLLPEATALGAALTAGLSGAMLAGVGDVIAIAERARQAGSAAWPDGARHRIYRSQFEEGYLPLQEPLRRYDRTRWRGTGHNRRSSG